MDQLKDYPFGYEVSKLFEEGIQETPYAWHGTCTQAISYLAQHGSLPVTNGHGSKFFYVPEHINPGNQTEDAKGYAAWCAARMAVLEQIPFTPADGEDFMYALDKVDETDDELWMALVKEAASHCFSQKDLSNLIYTAEKQHKGVLLGVAESVREDFNETILVNSNEGFIETPDGGLSLKYITGIEALGDLEWSRLIALQEQLA